MTEEEKWTSNGPLRYSRVNSSPIRKISIHDYTHVSFCQEHLCLSRPNGQKTARSTVFFSPQLILQFTEGVQWFYYWGNYTFPRIHPYGKAVFVRVSDEYAANILRTAMYSNCLLYIHFLSRIPSEQSWTDKKVIAECLQFVI